MSKLLNISEPFSIALHSLVLIASQEKLITISEISDITKASKNHIAKIMQLLAKHNFLKSFRGPSGGFELGKKAEEIKLMDIYQITDGVISTYSCDLHQKGCSRINCVFGGLQEKFAVEFSEYLNNNTIYDLIIKK
ncbi:MAG: Rrf2 family transcriptional regulator [Bacteroidota bacterium]